MKKLFTCLMLMVGMLLPLTATAADLKADLTIYYDVSTFGDFSNKKLQVMIGHGSYSTTYAMKAVEGYDNLYSVNIGEVNDGNTWGNATQLGFMAADAIWGGESNGSSSQPKERIKWAPMYSGIYNITSTLSGNVLFTGKDALSITKDYKLPAKTPVITIAAAPEFATTTVGETSSATLKYTLENATEATATIEGEGFSISAQAVGSVTIAFAPEAEGDYTGTLTITSGEVKETVALAAKAVAAEAPKVPEFLNVTTPVFAEIIEGEVTTAEVTYKLVNATEATASVDGEFFSIKEQELGKVIIEFASEEAGVFEGTLTLTSGETVKEITFTATAKKAPVVITISFVNPDWTEAALYAWGADGLPSTWPGELMTKGENGKFTYDLTLPENGTYNFIINNNGKGTQSVDMTGVTESTCYNLGAKSGEKYNLVVAENCDYTPAPEPEPIDPYVAIRGTMTDWAMENDIKMTYNADAANGPEWYITAFEVPADGKFKVVSVDDKSKPTWYGSNKVDLQEGITNAGVGEADIALPAGKYDIYFKVNEGRIWIQKYVEPTPDPEPDPTPDPEPDPTPDPEPDPTPDPEPDPTPDPEPDPTPDPEPDPTPDPEPDPTPDPEPDPTPDPEPDPDPVPDPDNTITFTVQVPEGTVECWIAGTGTPAWTFIQMEAVEGEANMFTLTTTLDVLDGKEWKYSSGNDWAYCEKIDGGGNRTDAGNPDVVAAWEKLYDPNAEPIEPYYGIRGLDGVWKPENDVKLTPNAEGTEWYITGLEVDGTQAFKVVDVDATGAVQGWYGAGAVEANEALGKFGEGEDDITLAAGKYDIYFKVDSKTMWIQPASPSTDAEEAVAELIYAAEGTIYAPAPFAIIDLAGKDVTKANGALEGSYIVKTQNSVTKVLVK